jgi:hypothetical protein
LVFSHMHNREEGTNVKACNKFGNDPMKMCFEHKTRMKVDCKINVIRLCFYCVDCDLSWSIFCHEFFLCLGKHIFLSPSLWFAFTQNVIQQIMFTSLCMYYVKQNNWKFSKPKQEKCNFSLKVLPYFFFG